MGFKNSKTFSMSHLLVPFVLLGIFLFVPSLRDWHLLMVIALSSLWAFYLIRKAAQLPAANGRFRKKQSILILLVDFSLMALILLLPNWNDLLGPSWLVLPFVLIYSSELGIRQALYISGCALTALVLFLFTTVSAPPLFDLFITLLSMVSFIYLIGRRTSSLQELAYQDPLTGLPNRSMFIEQLTFSLDAVQNKDRQLGLLFLDLDQFKYVNDTMGHSMGDQLLAQVAERIRTALPHDALLARMGGDEFTILLPEFLHTDRAVEIADTILDVMRPSFPLGHQEVFVTISIGISIFPVDGKDPETLMKNADTAMYRAKELGRNNYQFYSPVIDTMSSHRLKLEAMLRHALDRNEFVMLYQPRLNPLTGDMVSVEALVRWQHPEYGLLPPSEFIALAEETGLIVPLGEQVLRLTCRQRRAWMEKGLDQFQVSVNLSARQFRQTDLPETIASILREWKLSSDWLELEITETAAMHDVHFATLMMRVLKEMDLKIAIDDFGTGYSSLSYLRKFPIDVIKIDRSFIKGIENEPDDAAIVHAIIAMAQTLKLNVTAEGVETAEQYEYLKKLGCNQVQGYYIGKPMTPDELEAWMTRNSIADYA
ncbi:EAL domain-containing protein [Gorillibacterium sp. CAU 1737]|uniref:putative bifunctional diguanylate cyclase/phosphodiesterase n=1 Tax=Gorillibacterium sp. CAU 1737 TaxID=3140362 RepID=UPI003260854A